MKLKNTSILIVQLILIVFSIGCNENKDQVKFEKDKWNEQSDPLFPSAYRQQMLIELTTSYKLKGLKYSQLIGLLGIPDAKDSISLSYKIAVDYKNDIDPVYAKDLNFTFSKDSIIISFKVNEWKKK
jgi:hypothetical protein